MSNIEPCPRCKEFYLKGYNDGMDQILIAQKLIHEMSTNPRIIINEDQVLIEDKKQ